MASNKTTSKARYVINMETGSHGFRTSETDALPLTFRLIDDKTCKALCRGEIKGKDVVEAIRKQMMSAEGFSWEEFDRRRQAEKQRMNVSQHDMVPVGESAEKDAEPEQKEDVFSLESLGLGGKDPSKKSGKDKSNKDAPETPADAGDGGAPGNSKVNL